MITDKTPPELSLEKRPFNLGQLGEFVLHLGDDVEFVALDIRGAEYGGITRSQMLELFNVDKPLSRHFSTSTVNVAQEHDFHRIDVIGYEPNTIEDALANFEGEVARSIKKILARAHVGDDVDAQTLFYYMALLLVKNPAMRATVDDFVQQIMTSIAKHDAENSEFFSAKINNLIACGEMEADTDIEALRQSILRDDYGLSLAREGHLDMEFNNAKELLNLLRPTETYRAAVT